MSDKPTEAAPAKKGGKKILIIAVAAIVLLGGGGAGAYFMMRKPAEAADEGTSDGKAEKSSKKGKKKADDPASHGVVSFEPFVVNLADAGGHTFLRLTVRLIMDESDAAEKISKTEVTMARARAQILEILTQQTGEKLVTADGKAELKKAIQEAAEKLLEPAEVSDVLFSDFVVQF